MAARPNMKPWPCCAANGSPMFLSWIYTRIKQDNVPWVCSGIQGCGSLTCRVSWRSHIFIHMQVLLMEVSNLAGHDTKWQRGRDDQLMAKPYSGWIKRECIRHWGINNYSSYLPIKLCVVVGTVSDRTASPWLFIKSDYRVPLVLQAPYRWLDVSVKHTQKSFIRADSMHARIVFRGLWQSGDRAQGPRVTAIPDRSLQMLITQQSSQALST